MGDVVNPNVVAALIPNADIHAVLTVCGFMDVATCTRIINNEGFQSLADFGVLHDDKNVLEMAKHLGSCTEVVRHVYVASMWSSIWGDIIFLMMSPPMNTTLWMKILV
jgi:hypothetical protein